MPELPEVETARRVLAPQLTGRRITDVRVLCPQVIAYPDAEVFCGGVAGAVVLGLARRGKFLLLQLDRGTVTLHLRMTGRLLVQPAGAPAEPHTHLILALDDGRALRFLDQRRFGRFWLTAPDEADIRSGVHRLGLEPFDAALTADYLQRRLGRSARTVKACLLDQQTVCGIGNIYADEILFAARIHPAQPANTLPAAAWALLAVEIPRRLAYYIEKNAVSAEGYLEDGGRAYRNTPWLQVYGRAGTPCPRCGAPLQKTTVAGRGTVFCPACQPLL